MNAPIYEPEPDAPNRTQLLPWFLASGFLLLVALLAFYYTEWPVLYYKDSVVLRVLASDSALQLGAIDLDKDIDGEVDATIAYLEVAVKWIGWGKDEYGLPQCHIKPRQESVPSVAHFLSSHADRSAVVDVDGRAVHVIRLAESSPELIVLRFYYPWRTPEGQPSRDIDALRELLVERAR